MPIRPVEFVEPSRLTLKPCILERVRLMSQSTIPESRGFKETLTPLNILNAESLEYVVFTSFSSYWSPGWRVHIFLSTLSLNLRSLS